MTSPTPQGHPGSPAAGRGGGGSARPVDLDQLADDVEDLTREHHEGRSHRPGLIWQLRQVEGRTLNSTASGDKIRSGKAGSRPPAGLTAVDLLAEIEAGVWQHDADLRDELDAHLNYDRRWIVALDALPGLAGRLKEAEKHALTRALARSVRQWRNACRVHLGYIAPMSKLGGACPYCCLPSLIVRSDATSDVICTTEGCEDERGERPRWDRHSWLLLLEGQAG